MTLASYFKERHFDRLFNLLKNKYISLNRYSGTVVLKNVTLKESIDLSNFFGRTIEANSDFKTSFKEIEKKLKETKYASFKWDKLFKEYFNEKIITKKEAKKYSNQMDERQFNAILNKTPDKLKKTIKENKELIYQDDLLNVLKLVNITLKGKTISLTMLSSCTGNPHFLDFGLPASNLYFKILSKYLKVPEPKTSADKISFLSDFNVYIDTISNFVVVYNLISESPLINSFTESKEPLNLNLSNLSKIKTLDTLNKKVYVLENPSLLPYLKKYDVPLIISYGQPNYVFYKVIQKLLDSNNTIYYNGDLDPEGLLIAYNIYKKYPIKLFGYNVKEYHKLKSNKTLSESRLKKLDKIDINAFTPVIELLKEAKNPLYQENNLKQIEEFIIKHQ